MFTQQSKIPINHNPLLKGIAPSHSADYHITESTPTTSVNTARSIEAPRPERASGHTVFRRYPNNQLDYDYAVGKVIDALDLVKLGIAPLNEEMKVALSCLFPSMFNHVAAGMVETVITTSLRLSMLECDELIARVGEFLIAREQYRLSDKG